MNVTLKHVVALGEVLDTDSGRVCTIKAQFKTVTVSVRYNVTYHYDPGGWTSYGGDPPSHELDVNEARVVDWQIDGDDDGVESSFLEEEMVQKLYDAWANGHGEEVEGMIMDWVNDGGGAYDDGP